MENHFSIRIKVACDDDISKVDRILGIVSRIRKGMWEYIAIIKEDDPPFFFVQEFTKILEGKYLQLERLGIKRDDISFRRLYFYDYQCNMEYAPDELLAMGDNGIKFQISCEDVGDYENLEDINTD